MDSLSIVPERKTFIKACNTTLRNIYSAGGGTVKSQITLCGILFTFGDSSPVAVITEFLRDSDYGASLRSSRKPGTSGVMGFRPMARGRCGQKD